MAISFLTAAMLAAQVPAPDEHPTARQLYESCRSWVDTKAERTGFRNGGLVATSNLCQREALGLITDASDAANAPDGRGWVECVPEDVIGGFDPAATMGEAYLRYVDAKPAERDSPNGGAVFRAAIRQAWPCPR